MRIAFIGSRGIPARYSGFETFYEQVAVRLARRGHEVTVYNRKHFMGDVGSTFEGVRIVTLPSIATKHLDTLTHTALSSLHALFLGYDIAYYCIVGNSPLVWLGRLSGARTLLNVDGEDWAREKWGGFARWYQQQCEWIATRTAGMLISDARGIETRYRELYGAESIFVPYGANIRKGAGMGALKKWGLEPRGYYLCVGRFVPENGFHLGMEAFRKVRTDRKLVIVGDSPYETGYKEELKALASKDPRVVLTGYAFGDDYAELSSHAEAFVLPSAVDGTRPVLLDQMGFGNCLLVRNSLVNREVVEGWGHLFDKDQPVEALAREWQWIEEHPAEVQAYRDQVRTRIETYYNWEWVTDFYEDLFGRMKSGKRAVSYDAFLEGRPFEQKVTKVTEQGR